MKKTLLLFSLFLGYGVLLHAQMRNQPITERTETSDLVVEGRIVAQNSFWDINYHAIYTENKVEVFKSFKGADSDTVSIISRGGIVDDQFQIVSHAIEFNLFEEGVFFCKVYSMPHISASPILMLNDINGFVKYDYDTKRFRATDKFSVFTDLKTELYEPITRRTTSDFIVKKKNGLEKRIQAWLEETLAIVPSTDILIEFTFDNIYLIGTDEVEFDIMAKSNQENIKFAASDVYISYSAQAFGESVVANEKIEATKETVIENDVYTLILTDEASDIVKFLVNAGLEPTQLYPLSQIADKFLHIKLDIENIYELASLSFDDFLMENQSFFYDDAIGEFVGFDKISVENPVFPFLMPNITGFSPNPITAGTSSNLTITGTNFGATKGKVRFPNADDGGLTFMQADNADVITWNNTEIVVKVPSVRSGIGQTGAPAGSGIFQIETTAGEIAENNPLFHSPLNIRYAVANFRPIPTGIRPHMAALNDIGGYTFYPGFSLSNQPNAVSIVEQALCEWNMATGVTWLLNGTSIQNPVANGSDEVNTIFLGNESNFTGSTLGATAFTTITGDVCNDGTPNPPTYIKDVDIVLRANPGNISPGLSWHFSSTTNPSFFDFDFYSVVKHELGHAHNLKHAIPDDNLMYWQLPPGNIRRDFSADDINGGYDVLLASVVALTQGFCAVDPMATGVGTSCTNSTHDYGNERGHVIIYPNPNKGDNLYIQLEHISKKLERCELWGPAGEKITTLFDLAQNIENLTYTLNIPIGLQTGVYFIRGLDADNNILFVEKIIKL